LKNKTHDFINFLIIVNELNKEEEYLKFSVFLNHKIPFSTLKLQNSSPDIMLAEVVEETKTADLPNKMESALISIFTETQNSFALNSPPKEDIELLTVFSFTDETISTLFKNRDNKTVQLKKILAKTNNIKKKQFILPVFDKVLKLEPDCELFTNYLNYCVNIKEYKRVLALINNLNTLTRCEDGLKIRVGNIAILYHKYKEAEILFDSVLKNDFGNVLALIGKAQCRYQTDDDNYIVYLQKACNFNKKVTVETVTERFNFRKNKKIDLFDVISLKEAMEKATIPPEALEVKKHLSLPFRTEKIQGSIFFVKEELDAWKKTMDSLNIVSARFKTR
jgi:hypothetical protein